jgi:RNA polymerase sigma factor (sigma-70 family)
MARASGARSRWRAFLGSSAVPRTHGIGQMSAVSTSAKHPHTGVDRRTADDLAARDQSAIVPAGIGVAKIVTPRATEAVPDPPSALISTLDLVARVRNGDQDALEAVCLRCLKGLRCFAAGRVPPRIRGMLDTQDLVAEALEKGLARLLDLDLGREGALMAYLRQVLKNLIVDKIRAADRAPTSTLLDDQYVDDTQSPLEKALAREKVELYEAALQRLKPRDAEMIILRVEQQASYDEIAIYMGLPTANAARTAVRRALFRLAHAMSRVSRVQDGKSDGDRL